MVYTESNSVIGCYCSERWEDTSDKTNSLGWTGYKDIKSKKPFLFYFFDNKIEIITCRDDKIPTMASD